MSSDLSRPSPTLVPYVAVEFDLQPGAVAPTRATPGSSGYDVCAWGDTTWSLAPGQWRAFDLGFRMRIRTPHVEAQLRARSGLAARHGIMLLNGVGTIDADYRGPVKALLFNAGPVWVEIKPGERIAQLVFAATLPLQVAPWSGDDDSARGEGGFGSTGR